MAAIKFPIEAGHVLTFARSIGDANPIYADADYAAGTALGGLIAPPTFVQASAQFDPEYVLRPKIGELWFGSGKEPTSAGAYLPGSDMEGDGGSSGGIMHAEQRFEYHRHPRVGEELSATFRYGESWEKQSKNSGTLRFREEITEYHDGDGELVVTAIGVVVKTEGVSR